MHFEWYEAINRIAQSNNIVVSGHTKPDGDSVGACFGLASAIKKTGKEVSVLLEQYPKALDIVPGKDLVKNPCGEIDLFIALDCADKSRLGSAEKYFDKAKYTINIDHHVSNTMYADKNYVNATSSSTCEIVYDAIINGFSIDKDIASALYTGIMYDTGGLRHPYTTPDTFSIVSSLVEFKIPFTEILIELFYKHSYSQAKLLCKAIDNTCFICGNRVAYTTLTTDEMLEQNGSPLDTEGIVDYIKNFEGIEIAVFFYQTATNDIKASLRSNVGYNVSAIASALGGGGHANAAGCTLNMPMSEASRVVISEIEKLITKGKSL